MGRRRIIIGLALAALFVIAVTGALLQLARGQRPVLLAA
jgi:hypothetical protein